MRKKNCFIEEEKSPFLFVENVTINTSERGMKFGGKERAEHNIHCGNEQVNCMCLFNLKVKISNTPMRDLLEPSP